MAARDYLYQLGVFDLRPARPAIEHFARAWAEAGFEATEIEHFREFTSLSTAECALSGAFVSPYRLSLPLAAPIVTSPDDAMVAMTRGYCIPTRPVHTRGNPSEYKLWDVAVFAGDMHKLELALDGGDTAEALLHGRLEEAITTLDARYRESPLGYADAVRRSGVLRLQGLLWKAKLALLFQPDKVEEDMLAYHDHFLVEADEPGHVTAP
jgi:hypothetical protein